MTKRLLFVSVFVLCACGGSDNQASLDSDQAIEDSSSPKTPEPDRRQDVVEAGQRQHASELPNKVDADTDASVYDAGVLDASIDVIDNKPDVIVDTRQEAGDVVADVAADAAKDVGGVDSTAPHDASVVDVVAEAAPVLLPIGCGPGMRYTVLNVLEVKDNSQSRLWRRQQMSSSTYAEAAKYCYNSGFRLPTVAELTAITGTSWAECAWGTYELFVWTSGQTTTDKATLFMTMNNGQTTAIKLVVKTAPAHYMCVTGPK